ncbi:MAG TPA: site-2 protease family protein [Gemmatimonadaceae bacterium]|nr:site-2 protease family protein [Gemmatimonadaceae bacterium]
MNSFQSFLFVAPILLFSVIAHEIAHGYAALRQGDPTAFQLGRLTWNPVRHIDPFMTILLPAMLWIGSGGKVVLGGAKPVPVNPRNYRHYKRGDIIVSLAGVATNFVVAIACAVLIVVFGVAGKALAAATATFGILQVMMVYGVYLNLALIAFNLIPIPPLDGSHVAKYLLPVRWSWRYQQLGRYGIVVLIILLWFPAVLNAWMAPADYVTQHLLSAVDRFVLPSATQWFAP